MTHAAEWRGSRLGSRMPVVNRPPRGEPERIGGVGLFGRGHEIGRLDDHAALGIAGAILLRRDLRARDEIVPAELAKIGRGSEHAASVQPLGPVRAVRGAGPLNARRAVELVVAQPRVVAGTSARAFASRVERAFEVVPFDQRLSVPVAKVHPFPAV